MTRPSKTILSLAAVALIATFVVPAAYAGDQRADGTSASAQAAMATAATFAQAKALSADTGKPILIKVGGEGCKSCQAFEVAAGKAGSDVCRSLAESVVLLTVNGGKGEGEDIARMYSVNQQYPTFVLVNAQGELMDRWSGYYKEGDFVANLSSAVANPITVAERRARFVESPNELDARKFGELAEYAGQYAEAATFYQRALSLNPRSEVNYDLLALNAMGRGLETGLYTVSEVCTQADRALNAASQPGQSLKVAYTMGKVARKAHDFGYYVPYLQAAVERTAGVEDEMVQAKRTKLLPDYALHVQKDAEKAVKLQKNEYASYDKNWMENANLLNNFAWWCFENEVNLVEADQLARKGVELAEAGIQRANILDTVAEICNLKGDCHEAVHYIEMAVAEAPENQYFQKQLQRFQEELAMMEAGGR